MERFGGWILAASLMLAISLEGTAAAAAESTKNGNREFFEITVTNLSKGQEIAPMIAASHKEGLRLFILGRPASRPIAVMAEAGDTSPLERRFRSSRRVADIDFTSRDVRPGQSITMRVQSRGRFDRVSLAGMLIPTNDGFIALNGVQGPIGSEPLVLRVPAYDAGTEANDELCRNIPGPPKACGGRGSSKPAPSDEGFVHVHPGIHGEGDLKVSEWDWRNPIAEIVIRRVSR